MIDFMNLPNYTFSDRELEEFLIFSVCVANKTAKTIAPRVDWLCRQYEGSPLQGLDQFSQPRIRTLLKRSGIGCYALKSKALKSAARLICQGRLDLRNCSVEDLESLPGIGLKTSRFFVLHTRRRVKHAILDTHLLKFLRAQGHDAPLVTPKSAKRYNELEGFILTYAAQAKQTPAEFDITIWKRYAVA